MSTLCRLLLVSCLGPVVLGLSSCRTPAATLGTEVLPIEKDVLACRVDLSAPLAPEEYVAWAARDLARMDGHPINPFYPETPIYQLRYLFFEGGQHLASVYFQRAESGQPAGQLLYQHARVHRSEAAR